jgi:deoxyribodipyrimidine photo-lyase
MGVSVVWFKRDLRVRDNAALSGAMTRSIAPGGGGVLCLYVYERSVWQARDGDARHLAFVNQSLAELEVGLALLGLGLVRVVGEMPLVLARLSERLAGLGGIRELFSHEETGNAVTYARDRRVARWCEEAGVMWHEPSQSGVVRRLRSRDGWAQRWHERMASALATVPKGWAGSGRCAARAAGLLEGDGAFGVCGEVGPAALGLAPSLAIEAQPGGERAAHGLLSSFLSSRGRGYRAAMSSPGSAWEGCSRLSPHLAWGTISTREVFQAVEGRRGEVEAWRPGLERKRWLDSLSSFASRLRWRDHFMQKLESEPGVEFRNFSRAYDGLREEDASRWSDVEHARFAAWCEGRTGYPMVDACVRCVVATGWLNFRMRAMLASFAAYHLWLHWREPGVYLARQFVDFEPGIHYCQFQMQSGTTGINTVRVYSPAKQLEDHDPTGEFVRRWVPELSGVPDEYLAEPRTMPALTQAMARCEVGVDYPLPIVEHRAAYARARALVYERRSGSAARAEAQRVYDRHGSRKPTTRGAEARRRAAFDDDRGGAVERDEGPG